MLDPILKNFQFPSLEMEVLVEEWPIKSGGFTISRGTKTSASVIVVKLSDGQTTGWAECVPYGRYGETLESVTGQIDTIRAKLTTGEHTLESITSELQPGAAMNVINCALWDFISKFTQQRAYSLAGLQKLSPVHTAYTISLSTPEKMAAEAAQYAYLGLLKIKLGGTNDEESMLAIRNATPEARLIADANEAWNKNNIESLLDVAEQAKFELIEQPLPADADELLSEINHAVPICADESIHISSDLDEITVRYDAINIKLDKTGGLNEAFHLLEMAKSNGLKIMVGCMVGTSLAMAPALLLAQYADWVDLDGPLLLAEDRSPGLTFDGANIYPSTDVLWG